MGRFLYFWSAAGEKIQQIYVHKPLLPYFFDRFCSIILSSRNSFVNFVPGSQKFTRDRNTRDKNIFWKYTRDVTHVTRKIRVTKILCETLTSPKTTCSYFKRHSYDVLGPFPSSGNVIRSLDLKCKNQADLALRRWERSRGSRDRRSTPTKWPPSPHGTGWLRRILFLFLF